MKHFVYITCAMIALTCLPGVAGANVYTFQPNDHEGNPTDLWDLDHYHWYSWGIQWGLPEGETIVAANLFFDNIRNWDGSPNDLYVHLLDLNSVGASQYTDTRMPEPDALYGQGPLLVHYEDLSAIADDITYDFSMSDIGTLNEYLTNDPLGLFGFGFDPDCHFYNDGITFTIETQTVPLPGALLLGGLGLSSAVAVLKRRRQAS